ncbi:Hypothetical predicted protein [Prunus dulcis]|uniref:Uncharacterized protein n=1 Tax=Prunus dulcis TaxID=3755 RepID=A0A5E4G1L0_PRUDU|nr:Hypothetical predicted protein [Prunus dulcis]
MIERLLSILRVKLELEKGDFRDSFGKEPAPQCESADFESTDLELLEEVEVPVMFSMDFLELNALTNWELARIQAMHYILDSVIMQILRSLESLSDPKGEWYSSSSIIIAFSVVEEGQPSDAQFSHLYSVTRAKSSYHGIGCSRTVCMWRAKALCGKSAKLTEDLVLTSSAGVQELGVGTCGKVVELCSRLRGDFWSLVGYRPSNKKRRSGVWAEGEGAALVRGLFADEKLRGLDETAKILIPGVEVEEGAKLMNVGYLSRVV